MNYCLGYAASAYEENIYDSIDYAAANGFEAGKYYSVIASATVGSTTGNCVALIFRCIPAEASAGVPDVNVTHISDDSTAADNAELAFDGTGYGFTGCTMPTTTTVTTAAITG